MARNKHKITIESDDIVKINTLLGLFLNSEMVDFLNEELPSENSIDLKEVEIFDDTDTKSNTVNYNKLMHHKIEL